MYRVLSVVALVVATVWLPRVAAADTARANYILGSHPATQTGASASYDACIYMVSDPDELNTVFGVPLERLTPLSGSWPAEYAHLAQQSGLNEALLVDRSAVPEFFVHVACTVQHVPPKPEGVEISNNPAYNAWAASAVTFDLVAISIRWNNIYGAAIQPIGRVRSMLSAFQAATGLQPMN